MSEETQTENLDEMKPGQIKWGFDEKGFWHFVVHEDEGIRGVLGFLEQMVDIVKVHYANKMRTALETKGILKPKNGFRPKWH